MSRTRRSTPPAPAATVEPALQEVSAVEEIDTEALVVEAVQKAVDIPNDEALAIRRLRNRLIDKLFTPDRTVNSWTDLKATN
jgi:hypothetical protein